MSKIPEHVKAARRARTRENRTRPARVALPCARLGPPTGETRPCKACGGKSVAVPLRACSAYGVCAVNRAVTLADGTPVRPCNALCPSYAPGESTAAPQGAQGR